MQKELDEQAFINPFSIAARDSDNSEKEVTAEGFFKNPDDVNNQLANTSTFMNKEEDVKNLAIPPKPINSNVEKRVSPFDVLQQ